MSRLATEVCGVRLKNPLLLASAPTAGTAASIKKALATGIGGVVAKSVSGLPEHQKALRPMFTMLHRKGYPTCFSNYSSGFASTLSPEEWQREMQEAKAYCDEAGAVLIGSVFSASGPEEWAALARMNEDLGVDMLELDISCPSTSGTSAFVASSAYESVEEIVRAVVGEVKVPVFAKLTADATNPVGVANACKAAGASGITALNRFPSLEVDITTGRPLLGSGFAGVGGPWMRPIMLRWVARLSLEVGLPVSATNGVWTWQDAVKAIMCGASTVQVCTAVMYSGKGFGILSEFLEALERYCEERGLASLDAVRGLTLPQIKTASEVEKPDKGTVWAVVDAELCRGCSRPVCANSCFHQAVVIGADGRAVVAKDNCEGCGLCAVLCPRRAISIAGPKEVWFGDYS